MAAAAAPAAMLVGSMCSVGGAAHGAQLRAHLAASGCRSARVPHAALAPAPERLVAGAAALALTSSVAASRARRFASGAAGRNSRRPRGRRPTRNTIAQASGGAVEVNVESAPTEEASSSSHTRLTGRTLKAALKMRCDTSGAEYALYWVNVDGYLTVAGSYVTPGHQGALKAAGTEGSFAEVSQYERPPAKGCEGPVSTVYNLGVPLHIVDAATDSSLGRRALAAKYGIRSIAFKPCEGGVLEYGTCTTSWQDGPPGVPDMPKRQMRTAFEDLGASYVMFWEEQGGEFRAIVDYSCEDWVRSLQSRRGDDKTFCSESRAFSLPASGDDPVASAAKLGIELRVKVDEALTLQRKSLAEDFGIQAIHLMPVPGGVLECGICAQDRLNGHTLDAALKMRCDTAGAGYSIYWTEVQGKFVVSGGYTTPQVHKALGSRGISGSFVDASRGAALDAGSSGPVAQCARHGQPTFVQDAASCEAMARSSLAADYGVASICFKPVKGGVLEFGTTAGPATATWDCMPACPDLPKDEMRKAFEELGAVYVLFWQLRGDTFVVTADYVIPEHVQAMKNRYNNDVSFASVSRWFSIPADDKGYVATAARSGKEFVIPDAAADERLLRQQLAQEFNIGQVHVVPGKDGVLEYGMARV